VSFGDEEEPRRRQPASPVPARIERMRGGPSRVPPLLLLLAVLLVALLAVAAILLWRSLGDTLSGTSVAQDSIASGPKPRVRLATNAGQVRIEGVRGLESLEYEVTKYATAGDPAAAKREASQVPVDLSREDSSFVLKTDGGRDTGADYTLRVPSEGSVEVESGAGDIEVNGLSGDVTVLAGAGDVTVRNTGSDVSVEAPRGDVLVGDVNTETGQAEIKVGSGDVTLQDIVVGTLEADVEAGDVTLTGRFSGSGRISVETGDIIANLPPEDTRELTLETRVGGVERQSPPEGQRPRNAGSA
jgi:DUF4097 and DUF4098 domain-containing protein YvlB